MRLTPVSYVVLGFVDFLGEATPYQLKKLVGESVGNFWSFPHAQLYTEPERLAAAGLLEEEREQGGRRRKRYRVTDAGRRALREWTATPHRELPELRDTALLKLFFGAEPAAIAATQLEAHRAKLAEYEALYERIRDMQPRGPVLALEMGLAYERNAIAYWKRLAGEEA